MKKPVKDFIKSVLKFVSNVPTALTVFAEYAAVLCRQEPPRQGLIVRAPIKSGKPYLI
jgi:hypothetical protein